MSGTTPVQLARNTGEGMCLWLHDLIESGRNSKSIAAGGQARITWWTFASVSWSMMIASTIAQLGRLGGSRWGWVLPIKFPCHTFISHSKGRRRARELMRRSGLASKLWCSWRPPGRDRTAVTFLDCMCFRETLVFVKMTSRRRCALLNTAKRRSRGETIRDPRELRWRDMAGTGNKKDLGGKRWRVGVNAPGAIRRPFEPGGKPGLFMFGRLPRLRRR